MEPIQNNNKFTSITALLVAVIVVIIAIYFLNKADKALPDNPKNSTPSFIQTTEQFACNAGKFIDATFTSSSTVTVVLSDARTLSLTQTTSTDGNRYVNQENNIVFWYKGNGALILENNTDQSYTGCIRLANQPAGANLSQIYANGNLGFSLRFPSLVASSSAGYADSYKVDESYRYEYIGPGREIYGVKFNIPEKYTPQGGAGKTGTNLSKDSYLSVEQLYRLQSCTANQFSQFPETPMQTVSEDNVTYSKLTTGDAAAGNYYDEIIYAIPGTNPCVAVRYFIHSTNAANYEPGTIKEFDKTALLKELDQIRRTLVINQ